MWVHLSWSRLEDGSYGVLANGRARADLGAVRFALEVDGAGPTRVAATGGRWVTELAPTTQSGTLARSYVVVGYDAHGDEIARVDLNGVVRAASPPS